jgi:hypothetical protein
MSGAQSRIRETPCVPLHGALWFANAWLVFSVCQQPSGAMTTQADGNFSMPGGVSGATSSGVLSWLIVPLDASALSGPVQYSVGGTLSYTVPGIGFTTIKLLAQTITVNPDPRFDVRYYIPMFIQGDNPFTAVLEPSVPATVGTLIFNFGGGAATDLQMKSVQPQIVDNQKGLVVNFTIVEVCQGAITVTPLRSPFGRQARCCHSSEHVGLCRVS